MCLCVCAFLRVHTQTCTIREVSHAIAANDTSGLRDLVDPTRIGQVVKIQAWRRGILGRKGIIPPKWPFGYRGLQVHAHTRIHKLGLHNTKTDLLVICSDVFIDELRFIWMMVGLACMFRFV